MNASDPIIGGCLFVDVIVRCRLPRRVHDRIEVEVRNTSSRRITDIPQFNREKRRERGRKTILAIYEREGDTLRVCYDLSGKKRPTEFKTKEGTQLFLVTYKREKP